MFQESLDTKLKNHISYSEFEIIDNKDESQDANFYENVEMNFHKYKPISDYPSSIRDLSISLKDPQSYKSLENSILNFEHELLKEVYVFDFYNNKKNREIKIGFRFVFQSMNSTIKEVQVNEVMKAIINKIMTYKDVSIPGLI